MEREQSHQNSDHWVLLWGEKSVYSLTKCPGDLSLSVWVWALVEWWDEVALGHTWANSGEEYSEVFCSKEIEGSTTRFFLLGMLHRQTLSTFVIC